MTPIQVFDALNSKSFTYIECKDGSKFGGRPLKLKFCADEALEPACLKVTPDGLVHTSRRDRAAIPAVFILV